MKYLILLMFLTGCATTPKKGCTITAVVCDETHCVLSFDDNTQMLTPPEFGEYLKVGENICKK